MRKTAKTAAALAVCLLLLWGAFPRSGVIPAGGNVSAFIPMSKTALIRRILALSPDFTFESLAEKTQGELEQLLTQLIQSPV